MLDDNSAPQAKAAQAPKAPAPPQAPQTPEDLHALSAKRSELAQQLESVTDRREEVADQLEDADAAARPGLESRLGTLDARSVRLEQEILQADDAIAAALAKGVGVEAGLLAPTTIQIDDENLVSKDVMARALLFEGLAFVLLGIFLLRRTWRRARASGGSVAPDQSGRLEQLQHSIDAIAVEVERISEGQRYVTKALNEGVQPAVGVEARHEVLVPRKGT